MTTPAEERVAVGLVHGFHGLRGAVRIEVLSDEPHRFDVGSVLFVEGHDQPLTIAWTGPAKPGLLVRFEGFSTRESVEHLRRRYLEVAQESLPEGTYYWHQIKGMAAVTTEGVDLGTVVDVFRAGGGEVYVARGGTLDEVLIPAVSSVVVELDVDAGRLVVDAVALDLPKKPPRRRRRHEVTRRSRKEARAAKAGTRAKARPGSAAAADPVTSDSVTSDPVTSDSVTSDPATSDSVTSDSDAPEEGS